jgi:3-hydroxyisobutyrate dehydrogenase
MAKIAFIGLGHMGGGMAPNLAKAGHEVRAFDLSEEALGAAVEKGCVRAGSTDEAVADADVVITMLPAAQHVLDVHRNHVLGKAPASALLIDCSTIDVASARTIEDEASAQGYMMVDAPVSGGIAAAAGGALTFMVGGSGEAFDRAKPFIEPMAKAVIHAGGAGAGQAAKICNNMILGATMAATCEAFVLAEKLGLDLQTFFDIASKSSGQCWSLSTYCPVAGVGPQTPADRGFEGGFATAMMLKDLKLAQSAAARAGATTPMGAQAEALYALFDRLGYGGKDFSAVIELMRGRLDALEKR